MLYQTLEAWLAYYVHNSEWFGREEGIERDSICGNVKSEATTNEAFFWDICQDIQNDLFDFDYSLCYACSKCIGASNRPYSRPSRSRRQGVVCLLDKSPGRH